METETKARCISKGFGKGEALVCKDPIGFNFGVDVATGVITEHKHELEGVSFSGKVLVFPHGKGSTGGSYVIYQVACLGTAPAAIINRTSETIIACGTIMGGVPVVDKLDPRIYDSIKTGDWVEVDATNGTVKIVAGGDAT
jgi:predicted aconitase with swiveling domain